MSEDDVPVGHGYFTDADAIIALQKRLRQFELMLGYVMDQAMPAEEANTETLAKLTKRVEKLESSISLCRCRIDSSTETERDLFHTPTSE
jgi:hypothetical protein